MKHKEISLFPRNHETDVICKYKEDVDKFTINAVISHQGYNKQKMELCQEILFTDNANRALIDSDGLVLCDNIYKFGKKAYLNCLRDAKDLGKTVYTSSYLYDWLGKDVFSDCDVKLLNDVNEKRTYMMTSLVQIECPVISILGMGENCDKLATLLSMRKCFKDEGYKVLAISGNPVAKLLGCETLPSYMYSPDLSSTMKTIKINHYIHELVDEQNPDVVIISHAGGITKLNDYENNYFGEISYILANAIVSDYGIVCTYCNEYCTKEYYEYLKMMCKVKFGIDVLMFCVSPQNWKIDTEWRKTDFYFYSDDYFEKYILHKLQTGREIIVQGQMDAMKSLAREIINLLTSNVEIL